MEGAGGEKAERLAEEGIEGRILVLPALALDPHHRGLRRDGGAAAGGSGLAVC